MIFGCEDKKKSRMMNLHIEDLLVDHRVSNSLEESAEQTLQVGLTDFRKLI